MSMMRTHALPKYCATSGSSTRPMPAPMKTAILLSLRFMAGAPSRSIGDAFAEQALRSQGQHQDQHDEREDVLVVAAENAAGQHADVAGAERFNEAEQHAADHRAGQVADAAEDRRGERLQA